MLQGILYSLVAVVATAISAALLYVVDRITEAPGRQTARWLRRLLLLGVVAIYGILGSGSDWEWDRIVQFLIPMCALTVGYGVRCTVRSRRLPPQQQSVERTFLPLVFAAWLCFTLAWVVVDAGDDWSDRLAAAFVACILSASGGGVPIALFSPPPQRRERRE